MENIEQIYDFIKSLQEKIKPEDKTETQKNLIDFYFSIHNNPDLSFTAKRIQTELILEQILYLLISNQSLKN